MDNQTIIIRNGHSIAELALPDPEEGLYRGTRFDHAGIFRSIQCGDHVFSGRWAEGPVDPYRHDDVTGPVEEFSVIGYDTVQVGEGFLKIGVGWLRKTNDEPYNFRPAYPIIDAGVRSVRAEADRVLFRQRLHAGEWGYDYEKEVRWEKEDRLVLEHCLANTGSSPLTGTVYNHNFFTFDAAGTGTGTAVDLPFMPAGEWRTWPGDAPVGRLTSEGIRLDGDLTADEKICMERLATADGTPIPYRFSVRNTRVGLGVDVSSEASVSRIQFWGNHRVACMEPFTPFDILSGSIFRWTIVLDFRCFSPCNV